MSNKEVLKGLPVLVTVLTEESKIVEINNEHSGLLGQVEEFLKSDKYNSIVTIDNYKTMKASAQELSKTAKFISDFRIAKKKSEMTHIDLFEANLKDYCKLIKDKEQTIKDGLNIFEEETRQKILAVCNEYLLAFYDEVSLREEFRTVSVEDMTLSKYATAKMKIAKAGKDEIEKRVNEKLSLQNKVDNRLLSLDNECLRAEIEPLTQQHVQGFLYADDATYQENLARLIDTEKERTKKVQAAAVAKASIQSVKEPTKAEEPKEELKEVENPLKVSEDGKVSKTLTMKIRVQSTATDEQIIGAVINMIKADTFPRENIEVS